jgi:hypothetical protein
MSFPTTLNELHVVLKSADPIDVLHASWETFDLGERAADGVAWRDDFDDIQSLGAAQACSAGRALLPLPETGRPLPLLENPEESVSACAVLLQEVHRALSSLSSESPAGASLRPADLTAAAALAKEAAEALATLRTDQPCT